MKLCNDARFLIADSRIRVFFALNFFLHLAIYFTPFLRIYVAHCDACSVIVCKVGLFLSNGYHNSSFPLVLTFVIITIVFSSYTKTKVCR